METVKEVKVPYSDMMNYMMEKRPGSLKSKSVPHYEKLLVKVGWELYVDPTEVSDQWVFSFLTHKPYNWEDLVELSLDEEAE